MPATASEPDAPYTSTLLLGVGLERCTQALRACGTRAFVAGAEHGATIYPAADGPAPDQHHVGRALSEYCQARAISIWADPWQADLQYRLFQNGELVTQGRSDTYGTGSAGELHAFIAVVGQGSTESLRTVLTDRYSDPEELHREFLFALGLDDTSVGWGYSSLVTDGLDYPGINLLAVGEEDAPPATWSRDFERSAELVQAAFAANAR